jgi:Family of unknown function (DUF5706)
MGLDDAWKQLQQVHDSVRFADTKAGLILTLNGILAGLVAVRVQSAGFIGAHPVAAAVLIVALAFLTISIAFDIAAIMPRLIDRRQLPSPLHFEHIGATRQDDFVNDFVKLSQDSDQLRREIGAGVWANAVLARRKHRCVRWGLRFLSGALAAIVLAVLVGALGG